MSRITRLKLENSMSPGFKSNKYSRERESARAARKRKVGIGLQLRPCAWKALSRLQVRDTRFNWARREVFAARIENWHWQRRAAAGFCNAFCSSRSTSNAFPRIVRRQDQRWKSCVRCRVTVAFSRTIDSKSLVGWEKRHALTTNVFVRVVQI